MKTSETSSGHSSPAAADPKAGQNPGYAETEPRDAADARTPRTGKVPNPEVGGLERSGGADPSAAEPPAS